MFCILFNVCILSCVCHELFGWICCCALVCGTRVMALFGLCVLKSCNIPEAAWVIDSLVVIDSQVGVGVWGVQRKTGQAQFLCRYMFHWKLAQITVVTVCVLPFIYVINEVQVMHYCLCSFDMFTSCGTRAHFFFAFCVRFLAPFWGFLLICCSTEYQNKGGMNINPFTYMLVVRSLRK